MGFPNGVGCHFILQEIFPTQRPNLHLLQWEASSLPLSHQGSPLAYCVVPFSCSVVSDYLRPHELQYARLPCPPPIPGACSNSCPSTPKRHPTISSSIAPFSFHFQCFPASGFFPMSQFFTAGGQSIGVSVSASVLPKNIQD